ncbi:hypothetical protein HPP92_002602 [Vanilla planifolia]|uniref:Uncharacterized protein n=1 Tax=Vanilla planifolia TaxID=51239 RepID=A0A835S0L5_VANPL|nr:hypothetical protein HPP92_002602 [Vanilla planifolia]
MEVLRKVKKKRSIEKRKLRLNSIPHDLIVELTAVLGAAGRWRRMGGPTFAGDSVAVYAGGILRVWFQ